jgi:hypothetical protein
VRPRASSSYIGPRCMNPTNTLVCGVGLPKTSPTRYNKFNVLVQLRWPVLKWPRMAGFQVATEDTIMAFLWLLALAIVLGLIYALIKFVKWAWYN